MLKSNICFYDFETGSKTKDTTQPLQLAGVMIDGTRMEIMEDAVFSSMIRPLDDEEAIKAGVDPVQDDALAKNHLKREDLAKAPVLDVVWSNFVEWVGKYKVGASDWDRPAQAGFNIVNFDCIIIDRLCKQYGQWDKTWNTQRLFHPIHKLDIMSDVLRWTSGMRINRNNSISMDSVREWLGISKEMAHDARKDVFDGAHLLIKFMRLYRHFSTKVSWENSFESENLAIAELMQKYV